MTWTWMAQSDWQAYDAWPSAELRVEHSRRKQAKVENDRKWREANAEHIQAKAEERQRDAARSAWKYSAERKAAAGAEHVTSWSSVARLERRKGDAAKAEAEMEVDARRKRVRRINDEKEDRDALRELASSRNDCAHLELEQTPYAASDRTLHLRSPAGGNSTGLRGPTFGPTLCRAGLRETATDGTPRRAKAAGAQLRELTASFYSKLTNAMPPEELGTVQVPDSYYRSRRGKTRPLTAWDAISKTLTAEKAKAEKAREKARKKAEAKALKVPLP